MHLNGYARPAQVFTQDPPTCARVHRDAQTLPEECTEPPHAYKHANTNTHGIVHRPKSGGPSHAKSNLLSSSSMLNSSLAGSGGCGIAAAASNAIPPGTPVGL